MKTLAMVALTLAICMPWPFVAMAHYKIAKLESETRQLAAVMERALLALERAEEDKLARVEALELRLDLISSATRVGWAQAYRLLRDKDFARGLEGQ